MEGQNYVLPGESPGFLGDHDGMILTEREDDTLILEDINHTAYPESNVEVSGMTVTLTAAAGFAPPSVSFVVDTSDLGPVNRIRFDYQAVGDGCDGVTWLFVDGWKQAFRDERYFGGEVYAVDVFLDRMVPPGQCTISFGMACGDAEAGSAVTISDVRTGLMDARSTCAADMSSSDPDQPLPDGEVNLVDLLVALGNWGECEWDCSLAGCAGDTDFDCDVDLSDLLVIVESWGGCELD